MKRLAVLLVICAVAFVVPVLAAEKTAKAMHPTMSGEITKWDDASKTFSIKDAKGMEHNFVWNDKTKMEGTPAVGEKVTIHYMKHQDQEMAVNIMVHVAKKK